MAWKVGGMRKTDLGNKTAMVYTVMFWTVYFSLSCACTGDPKWKHKHVYTHIKSIYFYISYQFEHRIPAFCSTYELEYTQCCVSDYLAISNPLLSFCSVCGLQTPGGNIWLSNCFTLLTS